MEERQIKRTPTSIHITHPTVNKDGTVSGQASISFKFAPASATSQSSVQKAPSFTSSAKKPSKSNRLPQGSTGIFGTPFAISANTTVTFGSASGGDEKTATFTNPFNIAFGTPSKTPTFSPKANASKSSGESIQINSFSTSVPTWNQVTKNGTAKATDVKSETSAKPATPTNPFATPAKVTKTPVSPTAKQHLKEQAKAPLKAPENPPALPPLLLAPQHVPLPKTDVEDDWIFYSDRVAPGMLGLRALDDIAGSSATGTTAVNMAKIVYLTRLKASMQQKYAEWHQTPTKPTLPTLDLPSAKGSSITTN